MKNPLVYVLAAIMWLLAWPGRIIVPIVCWIGRQFVQALELVTEWTNPKK